MASHRSSAASALWLLALVLAVAGLSALDLELSSRPGEGWSRAFERAGLGGSGPEPAHDAGEPSDRLLLRVTCGEATGAERVFLISRPLDEGRSQEEVVAATRTLFALHFTGSVSVAVVAQKSEGPSPPDVSDVDRIAREWE